MVNACSVICCRTLDACHSKKTRGRLILHRFPLLQHEILHKWAAITGRDTTVWKPNPSSRICSHHFKKSDYIIGHGKNCLYPGAVPVYKYRNAKKYAMKKKRDEDQRNKLLGAKPVHSNNTHNAIDQSSNNDADDAIDQSNNNNADNAIDQSNNNDADDAIDQSSNNDADDASDQSSNNDADDAIDQPNYNDKFSYLKDEHNYHKGIYADFVDTYNLNGIERLQNKYQNFSNFENDWYNRYESRHDNDLINENEELSSDQEGSICNRKNQRYIFTSSFKAAILEDSTLSKDNPLVQLFNMSNQTTSNLNKSMTIGRKESLRSFQKKEEHENDDTDAFAKFVGSQIKGLRSHTKIYLSAKHRIKNVIKKAKEKIRQRFKYNRY